LTPEVVIGNDVTADIVAADSAAAPKQARIFSHDENNYYLQDISGKGTTLLNGRIIDPEERIRLAHGDQLSLGGVLFIFDAQEG
jgi:pSer/pThr/pTyr-binding forkhead associated (FHA) protein